MEGLSVVSRRDIFSGVEKYYTAASASGPGLIVASGTGEARRCKKLLLKDFGWAEDKPPNKAEKRAIRASKMGLGEPRGLKGSVEGECVLRGRRDGGTEWHSIRLFFVSTAAHGGCSRAWAKQ